MLVWVGAWIGVQTRKESCEEKWRTEGDVMSCGYSTTAVFM
jgi:hypothetical protein